MGPINYQYFINETPSTKALARDYTNLEKGQHHHVYVIREGNDLHFYSIESRAKFIATIAVSCFCNQSIIVKDSSINALFQESEPASKVSTPQAVTRNINETVLVDESSDENSVSDGPLPYEPPDVHPDGEKRTIRMVTSEQVQRHRENAPHLVDEHFADGKVPLDVQIQEARQREARLTAGHNIQKLTGDGFIPPSLLILPGGIRDPPNAAESHNEPEIAEKDRMDPTYDKERNAGATPTSPETAQEAPPTRDEDIDINFDETK